MERGEGTVVAAPKENKTKIPVLGIVALIIMLAIFVLIRETLQKGTKPVFGTPYEYPLTALVFALLILFLYKYRKKIT
jgi:hypothetical protein